MRTLLLAVALVVGPGVAQEGKVGGLYDHIKIYTQRELKVEWGLMESYGWPDPEDNFEVGRREDGIVVWRKVGGSK